MDKDKTADKSNVVKGIPASSGIVIGKAYVLDRRHFCVLKHLIQPDEIDNEVKQFKEAIDASLSEMGSLREGALEEFGEELPFMIFDAHLQILNDPSMRKRVEELIRENECNAEWALKLVMEEYQSRFSRIKNEYFRQRLQDVEEVITKIQGNLIHGEEPSLSALEEPVILVAHDITPADTLMIDPKKVLGIATDAGGRTSHAGIIAASMDIPAVVGLKDLSLKARTGNPIIVDGNTGLVTYLPTKEQFVEYNQKRQQYIYFDEALHAQKDLESITKDGTTVKILANIESSHDLVHLSEHGAQGVGLYRTEYLYINRRTMPNENEQYEDYKKVAQSVTPHSAIIRTFDLGGDKLPVYSGSFDDEPNPALGLRAIRFCLENRDIFLTQLKAILRASVHGNLKIMYPLITAIEEVTEANGVLDQAKDELTKSGIEFNDKIPVGIMIETPSSVMIARELARHCSFFSIGTNDLIQYTMAIDRVNEKVAYLYQPLSPAILRMISMTIKAADEAGISCSVCGKMAGDPTYAMLLLGFGKMRELSMDVHTIPRIKKFIRSIKLKDAEHLASHVLGLGSAKEVKQYLLSQVELFLMEGVNSDLLENDS
jgi:phosphotransferase system enzyme I (PtsI)